MYRFDSPGVERANHSSRIADELSDFSDAIVRLHEGGLPAISEVHLSARILNKSGPKSDIEMAASGLLEVVLQDKPDADMISVRRVNDSDEANTSEATWLHTDYTVHQVRRWGHWGVKAITGNAPDHIMTIGGRAPEVLRGKIKVPRDEVHRLGSIRSDDTIRPSSIEAAMRLRDAINNLPGVVVGSSRQFLRGPKNVGYLPLGKYDVEAMEEGVTYELDALSAHRMPRNLPVGRTLISY